jgi:hypothetical protein
VKYRINKEGNKEKHKKAGTKDGRKNEKEGTKRERKLNMPEWKKKQIIRRRTKLSSSSVQRAVV